MRRTLIVSGLALIIIFLAGSVLTPTLALAIATPHSALGGSSTGGSAGRISGSGSRCVGLLACPAGGVSGSGGTSSSGNGGSSTGGSVGGGVSGSGSRCLLACSHGASSSGNGGSSTGGSAGGISGSTGQTSTPTHQGSKQHPIGPPPPPLLTTPNITIISSGNAFPTVVNSTVHPQTVVFGQLATPPSLSPVLISFLEKAIDRTHGAPQVSDSNKQIYGPKYGTETDIQSAPEKLAHKPVLRTISMQVRADPSSFHVFVNTKVIPPTNDADIRSEPSVANKHNLVFFTGNWYAARSTNGGSTWMYLNPFIDMKDLCCDQRVIYDASHQMFIWYRQGLNDKNGINHFRLGISSDALTWHFYDYNPTEFNMTWTKQWFDYPTLALGGKYLYISSNMFDAQGNFIRTIISRWSLDDLINAVNNISFSYFSGGSQSAFNFAPVQGATDTMYWAIHLSDSSMRIYKWPENSIGITWFDRQVPSWNPSSGMSCPGPDGNNWCGFADNRILGGWISNGNVGFFWNTAQGYGFPWPYLNAATFRLDDMTYTGRPYLWSSKFAWQYGDVSPNSRGDLGLVAFYGGGRLYPSVALGIDNSALNGSPSLSQWKVIEILSGTNGPSVGEWGDFLNIRPYSGSGLLWVASGYILQGGNANDFIVPHYFVFGLDIDASDLNATCNMIGGIGIPKLGCRS